MELLYTLLGYLAVMLGVIGIFLPVLPTTPFLLLAAWLFFRSSPKAYQWLLQHPRLGPYIKSFREEHSLTLRIKVIILATLWLTALHCILFIFNYWWLKLIMAGVAFGVTFYILSLKTKSADK